MKNNQVRQRTRANRGKSFSLRFILEMKNFIWDPILVKTLRNCYLLLDFSITCTCKYNFKDGPSHISITESYQTKKTNC